MTTVDVSERNFEAFVEAALLRGGPDAPAEPGAVAEPEAPYGLYAAGGYARRSPTQYDRELCLDAGTLVSFVEATQPKKWGRLKQQYGDDTRQRFVKRVSSEIAKRDVLDVLRKGISDAGQKIDLVYFRPASGLNPETQTLYDANLFSVVRQLRYSTTNENSIDVVLFLNGIPIFTCELKNPLNGQDIEDAVRQYKNDRDPREPLLAFGRCLAHFAVDPQVCFLTTKLAGAATRFLPFNQGFDRGGGNPPRRTGFPTHYLWDHIWSKDSVLELIQRFIHIVEVEDDKGRKTGEKKLIFPRYHQLDAVRKLVGDAFRRGAGSDYLIQHSAGSGKSETIAWLAHQLSTLHDVADERVFDSIVVITDRRVLDKQLQRKVRQFEQTLGVVENIDTTSRQLKEALEAGKTIIVTTLQKFPVIMRDVEQLPQKRFAVIIDEAHSSQTGEAALQMHQVLSASTLEEAEEEDQVHEDAEDRIARIARSRKRLENVSMFAFTATPKQKTLQLFGDKRPDGSFGPFSEYPMRQAIDERFIMDVLENYTTYHVYWKLLKTVENDPRYDSKNAKYLARLFVDLHPHAIEKKVAIMVEHFHGHSAHRIKGRAKAMIVTRSRLHAVKTFQALNAYLDDHDLPYKALVAFSPFTYDGVGYSEAAFNGFPEKQTTTVFKQQDYRFLVVAEKFQTGFDEPLLHTMYVDKKLSGLHAVQTLSRLNRIHDDKDETMVLDFANDAEDIEAAFQKYYEVTILSEGADPNLLYDLHRKLVEAEVFDEREVEAFARIYFDPKRGQDELYGVIEEPQRRFKALEEDQRGSFRKNLATYTKMYAFLSQVATFVDASLESLYHFARHLAKKIPGEAKGLPFEVQQAIDLASFGIRQTTSGRIELQRGTGRLTPPGNGADSEPLADEKEPLSRIIADLNERFGFILSEKDGVFIEELEDRLETHAALEASMRANTPPNARLTFDHVVEDILADMADVNWELYRRVSDNESFGRFLTDRLFERYRRKIEGTAPGQELPSIVDQVVARLTSAMEPDKVIVFGSAASGGMHEDSDIDLVVVLPSLSDRHAATMEARRALRPLRLPFDVLVFSRDEFERWGDVPGHVLHTALTEGRIAYAA